MRAGWALLLLLVAGCTSFPADTRVVAAWDVPPLAAGQEWSDTTHVSGAAYLLLGYRIGEGDHVLLGLQSPSGARWAATSGDPPQACAVARPAEGEWRAVVVADAWDGNLSGGRLSLRASSEPVPALVTCRDAPWPGAGNRLTLAMANVTLAANGTAQLNATVSQPFASLQGLARGAPDLTLELQGPEGQHGSATATASPGAWSLIVRAPANATAALNATIAIRALGK